MRFGLGTTEVVLLTWMVLRDPAQTRQLYEKYKPTHVIHLAALGALSLHTFISVMKSDYFRSRRIVQEHEIQSKRPS